MLSYIHQHVLSYVDCLCLRLVVQRYLDCNLVLLVLLGSMQLQTFYLVHLNTHYHLDYQTNQNQNAI